MTQSTTNSTAPLTLDAPLSLSLPEPVVAIKQTEQASALIPFNDETRGAVTKQADEFIRELMTTDVSSDEFRARVDSAFRLGRKEIGESTLLTGKFMTESFAQDSDNPAFAVMNEMRGLFESLDPGKAGDLMSSNKLLGFIPFGNKLQAYLRRFDSAGGSLQKLIQNIYGVQDELARDDAELFATMTKLLDALTKLKAVDVFIERLDASLSATVVQLKATQPLRAKAIEQEVLFYARQASLDIKTQILVCINGYKMLEGLRKTGRELHIGCDRMATIGMSSLSIAVTLARAQGYQMKVMDALKSSSAAIEGLIASTAKMFGDHVDRVTEFQTNPLVGVQTLKASFDTVFASLDKLDDFRSKAIETTGANIELMRGLIVEGDARMSRPQTAAQALAETKSPTLNGPVSL